jgi:hypothetical protein
LVRWCCLAYSKQAAASSPRAVRRLLQAVEVLLRPALLKYRQVQQVGKERGEGFLNP